jgi:hypothetical protein
VNDSGNDPEAVAEVEARANARAAALRLLVVTLAIVTVAMVLMNRFLGTLRPACVNTVVESVASPDDEWSAVLFERSCGATSGFSSQVSVVRTGSALPDRAGNAFVLLRGDTAGTTSWGGPVVTLLWTGPRQLEISHDPTAHAMSSSRRVGDVDIRFAAAPAGP